jgi:hypothetical protein
MALELLGRQHATLDEVHEGADLVEMVVSAGRGRIDRHGLEPGTAPQ